MTVRTLRWIRAASGEEVVGEWFDDGKGLWGSYAEITIDGDRQGVRNFPTIREAREWIQRRMDEEC